MSLPAESQSAKGAAAAQLVSKTCQNCFSLKIRCDRTQRQDICDRCARLGKNCVFRPARRRDNSARRDSYVGSNPAATHTDTNPDVYRPSNNKYRTFSASKDPAQSSNNRSPRSMKNRTLVHRRHRTIPKMATSWTRTLCPSSGQRHWSKSIRLT